jgi:xanthine dehydrogenase FAD-binding subunit
VTNIPVRGYSRLAEVIAEIRRHPGRIVFVAGGTDLMLRMRSEGVAGDLLLDLSQVGDLRYIREDKGRIRIGAATPFAEIAANPLIGKKALCLAQASARIGSLQIRNRATLGGNIANASPAGDSLPPLSVLEATAHTVGPREDRTLAVAEMNIAPWKSGLRPNELIREISFPAPAENSLSGFAKLGHRKSVSVSKLTLALRVEYDRGNRTIVTGRAALGAIGRNPILPEGIPPFLEGRKVDPDLASGLTGRLARSIDESIRGRESRPYKRAAVKGLTYDLLHGLFGLSPEAP